MSASTRRIWTRVISGPGSTSSCSTVRGCRAPAGAAAAAGGGRAAGAAGAPGAAPQAGGRGAGGGRAGGGRAGFTPEPIPAEFAQRQGQVSAQTIAAVKQFVEEGGTVIAIGS